MLFETYVTAKALSSKTTEYGGLELGPNMALQIEL